MAENDLDKYLSDLGIDTAEAEEKKSAPSFAAPQPAVSEDDEPESVRKVLTPLPLGGEGPAERCESFLVNLLRNLDPDYAVEVREVEDGLQADVHGGEPGKIIGRGGRTLSALEYLTTAVVNKDENAPHVRVSVDVGGYKQRRDERLRGVALKAAARARKTGFAVELEPMSAAERRVIHMTLADEPEVESESSGEGRDRRVVVKPL